MKSYMEKAGTTQRKWYILDASGKSVGRTAAMAAAILRGKTKPTYTPNVDCGDHVIILNCEKAVFTGNKINEKVYRHHSGWVGGLYTTTAKELMATKPELVMYKAVKGMLPDTTIGRSALTRLRAYAGSEHEQQAQKPEVWPGEIK